MNKLEKEKVKKKHYKKLLLIVSRPELQLYIKKSSFMHVKKIRFLPRAICTLEPGVRPISIE